MSIERDTRFWDRASRRYANAAIADQAGYDRTLARTRALLKPESRVLELGCGTGTTALRLATDVREYVAADLSPGMIAIAEERQSGGTGALAGLRFRVATAEALKRDAASFDAVLGFNYLHLVRDLPGTLRHIHALLSDDGLFISKTPCVGDMGPLVGRVALPLMRALRLAPFAAVFRADMLRARIVAAGFDILAIENHATKGRDCRPYIVARKRR